MADKAIDVCLNDHLAGAMLGSDLAEQIRDRNENTPLGELMKTLAPRIEEDRHTLIGLMRRMDTSKSAIKQAGAWVTEKASRAKFGGLTSGEPQLGTFMAVESLALGVLGKLTQYDLLEHERLEASRSALSDAHAAADR